MNQKIDNDLYSRIALALGGESRGWSKLVVQQYSLTMLREFVNSRVIGRDQELYNEITSLLDEKSPKPALDDDSMWPLPDGCTWFQRSDGEYAVRFRDGWVGVTYGRLLIHGDNGAPALAVRVLLARLEGVAQHT
jgi:hypothetical protein